MKLKKGDYVMFSDSVVSRAGHDKTIADMRGIVIDIVSHGAVAVVDTNGTFISEEGKSIRYIPVKNLSYDNRSGANNKYLGRF